MNRSQGSDPFHEMRIPGVAGVKMITPSGVFGEEATFETDINTLVHYY